MASAILLFYTSEGFFVAADGRARTDGVVVTDTMTKIFRISEPNRSLAYAFGGTVTFTDKDDPDIFLYDFRKEALAAIESLRKRTYGDLAFYAAATDCRAWRAVKGNDCHFCASWVSLAAVPSLCLQSAAPPARQNHEQRKIFLSR